jgi:hypothetical protein
MHKRFLEHNTELYMSRHAPVRWIRLTLVIMCCAAHELCLLAGMDHVLCQVRVCRFEPKNADK